MTDNTASPGEMALSDEDALISGWLGQLLSQLDGSLPPETRATLLKGCALAHYQHLNMEQILDSYKGDLPAFIRFLNETWHWQITYDQDTQAIIADEKKFLCMPSGATPIGQIFRIVLLFRRLCRAHVCHGARPAGESYRHPIGFAGRCKLCLFDSNSVTLRSILSN